MKDILTSLLNTSPLKYLTDSFLIDDQAVPKRHPHVAKWTTIEPMQEWTVNLLGVPHQVRLRNALSTDVEAIVQLESICYGGYLAWEKRDFEQDLSKNPFAVYWVIENLTPSDKAYDHQVVGLISGRFQQKSAHISHLFILPAFREQGLAQKLVMHWLTQARQAEIQQASLEVRASNTTAQALYQKLGFKFTGEKARYYYNNDETAYLMTAYLKEG